MADETRKIRLDSSERYPFFSAQRDGGYEIEVSAADADRWSRAMHDFDQVQREMEREYDAARNRDAEQERIRRAQAEVAAAEARLERAMWEVEHRPDDPASWPFIRVEGPKPCVGPQHPDDKAAKAERMRLHNAWPGIRFDLKAYMCDDGHWHIGRTS